MDSCLFKGYKHKVKCKCSHPGFEPAALTPFFMTITITVSAWINPIFSLLLVSDMIPLSLKYWVYIQNKSMWFYFWQKKFYSHSSKFKKDITLLFYLEFLNGYWILISVNFFHNLCRSKKPMSNWKIWCVQNTLFFFFFFFFFFSPLLLKFIKQWLEQEWLYFYCCFFFFFFFFFFNLKFSKIHMLHYNFPAWHNFLCGLTA